MSLRPHSMKRFVRQVENAVLLAICYAKKLVYGRANRVPSEILSILVVQTAKLGDMVCSTPVFHAIRQRFPEARMVVLGDSVGKEVLKDNPDVDDYILDIKNPLALSRVLRRQRFAASIILVPDSKALAAAYLAGIPFIAASRIEGGFCPWQTRT